MSGPFRPGPPPGGPRPGPPAGARPGPTAGHRPGPVDLPEGDETGHPAVDAAVQAIVNAATLAPADQIPQYEAAYETLRKTLATIDQT